MEAQLPWRGYSIDESSVTPVLASDLFHVSVFVTAASCLKLRTLEIMHDEEAISLLGSHVHSRCSSARGSTRTPSYSTLRQACVVLAHACADDAAGGEKACWESRLSVEQEIRDVEIRTSLLFEREVSKMLQ